MDALKKSVQAQGKGKSAPTPKRGAARGGAKKSSKSAPKRKSA
jgi:hypothetical protein